MKLSKKEKDFYQQLDVNITISESTHIDMVVEEVYPKLKMANDNARISKLNLKLILLNLYKNYMVHKKLLTGFNQNVNKYKPKSRYNKNSISKAIIGVVKALDSQGYIEYNNGYNSKVPWLDSHVARIKAKLRLINIIRKHKVDFNQIEKLPNTECIIVQVTKGSSKTKMEYEDTPLTNKMRDELINYNNLLKKTSVDITSVPEEGIIFGSADYPVTINQKNKFVRRIFNDLKFETGGRFYGGFWQSLNEEWRNQLTFDLEPTVEEDFRANGINILYAKEQVEPPTGDMYDLTSVGYKHYKYTVEDLRPLLKLMLLIMINASNYTEAYYAIKGDVNDTNKKLPQGVDLKPLMAKFEEKHSAIKKYFYSGFGASLYKYDSTVAEHVINYFTNKDVPVLCIHDSFIIELQYLEELRTVMQNSFKLTMFSDVAPKVNTPWITEVKYHHSEKLFNVTGLASLVPLKLKEHSIIKYFFADGQMLTKKDKGSTEANERYIKFKDNQMRIEDNYYNNKK